LPVESPRRDFERRVKRALGACGYDEAINYSFVPPAALAALGMPAQIAVRNPLSVEQSAMRTTLLAGLLQNVSRNVRHHVESVRLFELGRVYRAPVGPWDDRSPPAIEVEHIAGVAHGRRNGRTWALPDQPLDFFDVKGAVEAVLETLRIQGARFEPVEVAHLHPRASASLVLAGKAAGVVGQVHPRVAAALDVPAQTVVFELDAGALLRAATLVPRSVPLTRFPAVFRDIALVVDAGLSAESVRQIIREVGGALVEEAALFDVYTGDRVAAGKKNLAFALSYRSPDKTLTDVEVNAAHERIVREVESRLGGALR